MSKEVWITVSMPLSSWDQLVSDYENLCGVPMDEVEIFENLEIDGMEER